MGNPKCYDALRREDLPLDGVHVSVRIVNLVAEVQIVQFFVNQQSTEIDCVYEFPLDEIGAICGFEVELADRLLMGEVRDKYGAKKEFESAITRGQTAALLEQQKPDIFRQLIGNVPPRSRVNIRITYVTELAVQPETGGAIFVLPTSIAPRYDPSGAPLSSTSLPFSRPWREMCLGRRVAFPGQQIDTWDSRPESLPWVAWKHSVPQFVVDRQLPTCFSITMEIEMASRLLSVESRTHHLSVEMGEGASTNRAAASLFHETQPMGKDLEIIIYQEQPHHPVVQVEVAPDGSGCAMLTMVPEFQSEPEPREFIFLVDCSGSMKGSKILAARKALNLFLQSLPLSSFFNVFRFGSSHRSLFTTSQPYNQANLVLAKEFAQSMEADLGGTEIMYPLQVILRSPSAMQSHLRQLFVLTDGEVSNTDEIIELCRKHAERTRIFSIGIGPAASRYLVQGIARAASGTAQFITGDADELQAQLLYQLNLATLPLVNKVHVEWLKEESPAISPRVSNFFPTGPAARGPGQTASEQQPHHPNNSSAHVIGSGRWYTQDSIAGPALSCPWSRNQDLYQTPFICPAIHSGCKFVMFCFLDAQQVTEMIEVKVLADVSAGGQLVFTVPVTKVSSIGRVIHLLAARNLIRDLSERRSHLHYRKQWSSGPFSFPETNYFSSWSPNTKQDVALKWELVPIYSPEVQSRSMIQRIGIRFGIVSEETSFVAVENWLDGRSAVVEVAKPLPMDAVSVEFRQKVQSLSGSATAGNNNPSMAFPTDALLAFRKSTLASLGPGVGKVHYKKFADSPAPSPPQASTFKSSISKSAAALMAHDPATADLNPFAVLVADHGSASHKIVEKAKPPSVAACFADVLAIQNFDGSVEASESAAVVLGLSSVSMVDGLSKHLAVTYSLRDEVARNVAHALTLLKVLEHQFALSKATWDMAARKTRSWVVSTLADSTGTSFEVITRELPFLVAMAPPSTR